MIHTGFDTKVLNFYMYLSHIDYPICLMVLSDMGVGWSSGGTALPKNLWP